MKGIVIEVLKNSIILMSEDGEFIQQESLGYNYQVGDEAKILFRKRVNNIYRKYIAIAAVLLLFVSSGIGFAAYYTPYGYINIDINPSLELKYNRFERVLDVKGINLDGVEIANNLDDFKHYKIKIAITEIISSVEEMGYFVESVENTVLITVNDKKYHKVIIEDLVDEIIENPIFPDIVITDGVAKDHNRYQLITNEVEISPGKLNLIDKITEESNDSDELDVGKYQFHSGKSVNELVDEVEEVNKNQKIYEIKGKQNNNMNDESDIQNNENNSDSTGNGNTGGNGKK